VNFYIEFEVLFKNTIRKEFKSFEAAFCWLEFNVENFSPNMIKKIKNG